MHYFSTNRTAPTATFREALELGQPLDGGLFFPSEIPRLESSFVSSLRSFTNEDIAFEIIRPYVAGEISDEALREICAETVSFPFPLVPVTDRISALELFHGPTLAFKDVGARFMSRCLRYFSKDNEQTTLVVVATSGDTGGAVAAGFHGVEGVQVVILYPKGRVSHVQEQQLTTLGGNVTTLEVRGSFDDCQSMAKKALADADIRSRARLTSANSINVARWLPQQFYYAYSLKQWDYDEPPIFSVPSGNFGNIAAGLLLHASGLPTERFIAACNANDVVVRYLDSGYYEPERSIQTLSNAMDVADPSNLSRLLQIFGQDLTKLRLTVRADSISDDETEHTMSEIYKRTGYVLDPHGAVGFRALADHLSEHGDRRGIFLATAHPVKFESVERIIGNYGVVPDSVKELDQKPKIAIEVGTHYDEMREILLNLV